MDIKGSVNCISDYKGRVSYIKLTGNISCYAVSRNKNGVRYYDRKLFEHMVYAIQNRFVDDTK